MNYEYEIQLLKNRVSLIEEVLNKVQVVLSKCVSTEALQQLVLLKQREIADLTDRVTALENEINLLKSEVFK